MSSETQNTRTGTEILFDHLIETTIHENPLAFPQLRREIYQGLGRIVDSEFDEEITRVIREADLSPEQFTAYRILQRMGLINLNNGAYSATENGVKIAQTLEREGIYKRERELPEHLFRL